MRSLTRGDVPTSPGVYALYRHGTRMYVGKAARLIDRVWRKHSGRGRVMTGSAMRRNVAQHLGIASANDIYTGAYQPTPHELARVRRRLDSCEIAWRECADDDAAVKLERAMKQEYRPPLTKI
jgi:predicted GIY-YIG superfamily endonuclease